MDPARPRESYRGPRGPLRVEHITLGREVIASGWIGERSSHTRFVLKYLLGYLNVRNYDGCWTELGNVVRTPIEK